MSTRFLNFQSWHWQWFSPNCNWPHHRPEPNTAYPAYPSYLSFYFRHSTLVHTYQWVICTILWRGSCERFRKKWDVPYKRVCRALRRYRQFFIGFPWARRVCRCLWLTFKRGFIGFVGGWCVWRMGTCCCGWGTLSWVVSGILGSFGLCFFTVVTASFWSLEIVDYWHWGLLRIAWIFDGLMGRSLGRS